MNQIDKENAIKFGLKIKTLRKEKNRSLNSFVLENGAITTATWSRAENGKTDIKLSSLIKIASIFGITVSELLKEIDFDYTIEEI